MEETDDWDKRTEADQAQLDQEVNSIPEENNQILEIKFDDKDSEQKLNGP